MGKYIEADNGKMFILTPSGLKSEYVRELFSLYPMYRHKVPAKWLFNGYVVEVEEEL